MKGSHIVIGIIVISVLLIGWSRLSAVKSAQSDSDVISSNGVHWHPQLQISIRGEAVEIPASIGLIGGHNPMHTHEPDGVVHLEYEGVVRNDDTRLGRFFDIWGREFNENQIFENVNNDTERVHMFVNGEENTEFENYLLQHEDQIEIRFE